MPSPKVPSVVTTVVFYKRIKREGIHLVDVQSGVGEGSASAGPC
jgi:hypothetical protein